MIRHFETYTKITSPYGKRISPISGKEEFHTGIDVVKKHQGAVLATTSGVVTYAGEGATGTGLGGFGNVVCIVDKNKHLHLYAHLDHVNCKKDDKVLKDQTIGTQGNTGKSAGSHLHYEIRSKDKPSYGWGFHIDPIKYLDEFYGQPIQKDWKQEGLEYLQKEYRLSDMWKATDSVDLGLLGTILKRLKP